MSSISADNDLATRMSRRWTIALGFYHIVIGMLILYLLFQLWPANIGANTEEDFRTVELFWPVFPLRVELFPERQMLLLVMLAGALGSYVHAATSFVNFTGSRSIVTSWRWWYVLRPFIGMALALGFYMATRAGFFSGSSGTADLNIVGFAAAAFMVGMFTKQATQKLSELFDVLFAVPTDRQPVQDKLDDKPAPPSSELPQPEVEVEAGKGKGGET